MVENEEWRLEYMTLRMRDRENIEKGLVAGRKEGLIAGRKEGLVAGRKEGLVAGRAESIIELLEDIGKISEKLKETIYAEQNVDRLKEWLHLAKKADTIEEFQKKM